MISSIPVIFSFAVFMATLVVVNYVFTITIFMAMTAVWCVHTYLSWMPLAYLWGIQAEYTPPPRSHVTSPHSFLVRDTTAGFNPIFWMI
eukprot:COSAG05_NODE_214_length_13907_cov_28.992178_20_plen_89_part_00